jgi:hypothetical protein
MVESGLAAKWTFGHQFFEVQRLFCQSILRIETFRVRDREEIIVMIVTRLEMRST